MVIARTDGAVCRACGGVLGDAIYVGWQGDCCSPKCATLSNDDQQPPVEEYALRRRPDAMLFPDEAAELRRRVEASDAEAVAAHNEVSRLMKEMATLKAETQHMLDILKDPVAVRVNILRGTIAKPDDLVWLHDTDGPVASLKLALAAAEQIAAIAKTQTGLLENDLRLAKTRTEHWRQENGKLHARIKTLEYEARSACSD